MKRKMRKLQLNRETINRMEGLQQVKGGIFHRDPGDTVEVNTWCEITSPAGTCNSTV